MENTILEARISLESLAIYRRLLEDDVIKKFYALIKGFDGENRDLSMFVNHYCDFYYALSECSPSNSFRDYIIDKIIYDDNAFSRNYQVCEFEALDDILVQAVRNDLICLEKTASVSSADIKDAALKYFWDSEFERDTIRRLPDWRLDNNIGIGIGDVPEKLRFSDDWDNFINSIALFHMKNGGGDFARYKGFVWEKNDDGGSLTGIEAIDNVRFGDLIGYEAERKEVVDNTLILLNGYPANNVLLYGDRGTGKSSTVKALLNEYHSLGLRIVEIPKRYLADLPAVIRIV